MKVSSKVQWTIVGGQRRLESLTKSGKATVLLRDMGPGKAVAGIKRYSVTALDGHNLLPVSRGFHDLAEARAYANKIWRAY